MLQASELRGRAPGKFGSAAHENLASRMKRTRAMRRRAINPPLLNFTAGFPRAASAIRSPSRCRGIRYAAQEMIP
jgi:hypothetical protein